MRLFVAVVANFVLPVAAVASTIGADALHDVSSKLEQTRLFEAKPLREASSVKANEEGVWYESDREAGFPLLEQDAVLLADDPKLTPVPVPIAFEVKRLDYPLPAAGMRQSRNFDGAPIYRVAAPSAMASMMSMLALLLVMHGRDYIRKPFAYVRRGFRLRYVRRV